MAKEKSEGQQAIDQMLANYEAQERAAQSAENHKKDLEFSRYKQDCRKRALDLAHSEIHSLNKAGIAQPKPEITTTELAETYYNWLISIPEK